MRLPDHSGLTVLQRLKEQAGTRHIPVHVISVEDRVEAAMHMGASVMRSSPPAAKSSRTCSPAWKPS
jgi:CheY-like chemotaxis protein